MAGPFLVGRHRAVIDASPQGVFEYLADMARHVEWNPEPGFQVTARPSHPPGVGSLYRRERTAEMQGPIIVRGGMGESLVTMVKETTIVVYQPHDAIVFHTRNSYNGLLHSIEEYAFELGNEVAGTSVMMVSRVEAMVPGVFIGPVYAIRLVRGVAERLLGDRLSRLFPGMSVGPYLSRIKDVVEKGKVAGGV